jgi:hypothetical protein
MTRTASLVAVLVLAGALAGCTGTRASGIWKDPDQQGSFAKVLVGVAGVDSTGRRAGEDALVARFPKGVAVASYNVIPAGSETDLDYLRAKLTKEGYDGVLVARLLGVDQELTTTTMPSAVTVYGYYGYAYTGFYAQQAVDVRKVVRVESKLFDLKTEKPVWTMVTETTDPSSRLQTADEVADLVVRKLAEGKLIAQPR